MERPPLPADARCALEVWTTDEGIEARYFVAEGEGRDVHDLLVEGVADVLAGERGYDLDAHVWLAQFVVRDKKVGCGYGTLDAEGSLLRHTLRALAAHAAVVLETAADRRAAEARLEVVEGLERALDRWDVLSALIGSSADKVDARRRLAGEPFRFSESQAEHVLDLTVARRTRLGRADLRQERASLEALLAELPPS